MWEYINLAKEKDKLLILKELKQPTALKVNLIKKEWKDKDTPSIINLIKKFKKYYCIQQATPTTTANNSAFVTV